ncbi:MAG: LytTR family transcriptional regulator DNA-binding domain-containing protein, partial [Lachnospiraceae bacterium]|nr:LytTR family transcriptional regulator DNA-binding domain-containing protein [Lachnospiraceae bacterium]
MVSMLLACSVKNELEMIELYTREMAARYTEEHWVYHRCLEEQSLHKYLSSVSEVDFACMDVELPRGIRYIQEIRSKNRQAFLILLAGAKTSPMSYLRPDILAESLILRPITAERAQEVLKEAVQEFARRFDAPDEKNSFVVEGREGKWVLDYEQILYFEAREKRIYVNTRDKEIGFYDTIDHLSDILPEKFLRCHRSFLINKEMVERVWLGKNMIVLLEGR